MAKEKNRYLKKIDEYLQQITEDTNFSAKVKKHYIDEREIVIVCMATSITQFKKNKAKLKKIRNEMQEDLIVYKSYMTEEIFYNESKPIYCAGMVLLIKLTLGEGE